MIEKVVKYKTEDGKLFDSLAAAQCHVTFKENETKLRSWIEEHLTATGVDEVYRELTSYAHRVRELLAPWDCL